jgi:hypothetical protein
MKNFIRVTQVSGGFEFDMIIKADQVVSVADITCLGGNKLFAEIDPKAQSSMMIKGINDVMYLKESIAVISASLKETLQ